MKIKNSQPELTDFQIRILNMLNYMCKITENEEVKNTEHIMKMFDLPNMIGTVISKPKVIIKNKVIKWNKEFEPSAKLAVDVDRWYRLYPKLINITRKFKFYFESMETHPFPFNEIWEQLEFFSSNEAKRSLLHNCEKDVDFIFSIDAEKSPKNGQNGHSLETIKLSKLGLFTFLSSSQKPWAKVFQRIMFELDQESIMLLRKQSAGIITLSVQANLIDSGDDAINYIKSEYRQLAKKLHEINCNPQLLLINIETFTIEKQISQLWDDAKIKALEIFNKPIDVEYIPNNDQLELSLLGSLTN
jgi:hypothetical protein